MSSVLGSRGQVTIEKDIRQALGVEPGWRVIQRLEGDRVTLEFRPPKHHRSLYGILGGKASRTFPTEAELERAIDEAWTHAAHDAAGADTPR